MADYIIRHVDTTLWAEFKAKAQSEGRGMRFILVRLIELYTTHGLARIEEALEHL